MWCGWNLSNAVLIQEDCSIYPDMAAYHSAAVTLGQAGLLKELVRLIECMRQKPTRRIKNMHRNWEPMLEPDVVIYNAVRAQYFSTVSGSTS